MSVRFNSVVFPLLWVPDPACVFVPYKHFNPTLARWKGQAVYQVNTSHTLHTLHTHTAFIGAHTHTRTHTHADTHTRRQTDTHTHTQTHRQTHTQMKTDEKQLKGFKDFASHFVNSACRIVSAPVWL